MWNYERAPNWTRVRVKSDLSSFNGIQRLELYTTGYTKKKKSEKKSSRPRAFTACKHSSQLEATFRDSSLAVATTIEGKKPKGARQRKYKVKESKMLGWAREP